MNWTSCLAYLEQQPHLMPVVLGPTACGKTRLAVQLAGRLKAEIIGADSRQVYREMDLGTGKDLSEYVYQNRPVPYHLIDIAEPGTEYNVFLYQQAFDKVYADILARGVRPLLCGGSGLYLQSAISSRRLAEVPENAALREELAPLSLNELSIRLSLYGPLHNHTDTESRSRCIRAIEIAEYEAKHPEAFFRTAPQVYLIGIEVEPDILRRRIRQRLDERLSQGMIEEVRALLDKGLKPEQLTYYGLEYKYVTDFLQSKTDEDTMREMLFTAICQFAKRQRTWFRGMERRGWNINWVSLDEAAALS